LGREVVFEACAKIGEVAIVENRAASKSDANAIERRGMVMLNPVQEEWDLRSPLSLWERVRG